MRKRIWILTLTINWLKIKMIAKRKLNLMLIKNKWRWEMHWLSKLMKLRHRVHNQVNRTYLSLYNHLYKIKVLIWVHKTFCQFNSSLIKYKSFPILTKCMLTVHLLIYLSKRILISKLQIKTKNKSISRF